MSESAATPQILIVDDDDLFRETLMQNLEDDGYRVRIAGNGSEALMAMRQRNDFDGVILDWNMPEMNGLQVLRQMRDAGFDLPVLFLTGHNDQIYEESALDSGAADFVDKSRSYAILKRRLELILEHDKTAPVGARGNGATAEDEANVEDIVFGPLTLRSASKRALWRDQEVDLTVSEFDIVHLLARTPGHDVRFREIYDNVHGKGFWAGQGEDGYRTNVRTFIKRIRKKFRDVDPEFDAIENYPGFGYRWADEGT